MVAGGVFNDHFYMEALVYGDCFYSYVDNMYGGIISDMFENDDEYEMLVGFRFTV